MTTTLSEVIAEVKAQLVAAQYRLDTELKGSSLDYFSDVEKAHLEGYIAGMSQVLDTLKKVV